MTQVSSGSFIGSANDCSLSNTAAFAALDTPIISNGNIRCKEGKNFFRKRPKGLGSHKRFCYTRRIGVGDVSIFLQTVPGCPVRFGCDVFANVHARFVRITNMNRIVERFQTLRCAKEKALLPYFTSGYPDCAHVEKLVKSADALGAAVVEIGEPYSDSIADGPTIQQSFRAALARGHHLEDTFDMVSRVRDCVSCGMVSMVSYSIVYRIGLDRFVGDAADAGFDGVIFPDVPVEESRSCREAARKAGLCYIGLNAPTTTPERVASIADSTTGFVYQIAAAGTTGERSAVWSDLGSAVERIRRHCDTPVCVGFGVSTADQVREVCRVAEGAIVGSAIIRRIRQACESESSDHVVEDVTSFLSDLSCGLTSAA